jgi:hypothetical protein
VTLVAGIAFGVWSGTVQIEDQTVQPLPFASSGGQTFSARAYRTPGVADASVNLALNVVNVELLDGSVTPVATGPTLMTSLGSGAFELEQSFQCAGSIQAYYEATFTHWFGLPGASRLPQGAGTYIEFDVAPPPGLSVEWTRVEKTWLDGVRNRLTGTPVFADCALAVPDPNAMSWTLSPGSALYWGFGAAQASTAVGRTVEVRLRSGLNAGPTPICVEVAFQGTTTAYDFSPEENGPIARRATLC